MTTHELFRLLEANRHRRVATAAYHLWEAAGRPHGRDLDFWLAAERACRRDADAEQQALRRRLLFRLAVCHDPAAAGGVPLRDADPEQRAALARAAAVAAIARNGTPPAAATPEQAEAARPDPVTATPTGWSRGWDWGFRWLFSRLGRRGR